LEGAGCPPPWGVGKNRPKKNFFGAIVKKKREDKIHGKGKRKKQTRFALEGGGGGGRVQGKPGRGFSHKKKGTALNAARKKRKKEDKKLSFKRGGLGERTREETIPPHKKQEGADRGRAYQGRAYPARELG